MMDDDKPYAALNGDKECWIVVAQGGLAFRFGPYTPPEAGAIMSRSLDERVVVSMVMNCGTEFDWELARDVAPAAPSDGQ